MKKIFLQPYFLTFLLVILLTVSKVGGVSAQQATSQGSLNRPSVATQGGKLRSCQVRESAIKTRMTHLLGLATNMESKFDKHAKRVENFYTSKVVSSGKTVANYDSLVADIAAKKAAASAALTKAQNDANGFSCTGGNPKTAMTQFREDMQAVKRALKDYRTSVKNLIVAVHAVTGQMEKAGGPKPTKP